MAWTYRVVQQPDASWQCRFGLQVFDVHDELADAVAHMSALAEADSPASIIAHPYGAVPLPVAEFPRTVRVERPLR